MVIELLEMVMRLKRVMCVSLFLVIVVIIGGDCHGDIFPQLPVTVIKTSNVICKEHGGIYVDGLKNFTLWAYEMWDSTAKSSNGILSGNRFQMGHYTECLETKAPFPTQYCLATITATIPRPKVDRDEYSLDFDPTHSIFERLYTYNDSSQESRREVSLGWCIPASCTTLDLEEYLNEYLNKSDSIFTKSNVTYKAKFVPELCTNAEEYKYFDKVDISFCILAVLLVLMVFVATAYDYCKSCKEMEQKPIKSRPSKLIMAFSARENFHDLIRADESNSALKILYGVRTICIMAIIMDHRFGTFTSSAIYNFNYVEKQYRSYATCLFFHGDLFVDTFFFLSGILVVYGLLNQFDKKVLNPLLLIVLRYVRLTPVYAFVIFYYATIFNHVGEGPLWKVVAGGDSKDCRTNWWTNLIYISNYVNTDHMCMTHTWYLPCDFHYFIIAIFLCLLLKSKRRYGLLLLTIATIISIAIPFVLTIVYRRPGLMQFYPEFLRSPKTYLDFKLTYSKSHTRATPYFVGMFAGYIYYRLKGSSRHVCKIKSGILILVSLGAMAAVLFSAKVFYDPYHPYDPLESASYSGFHRFGWSSGTFGLLYVGSYGHDGDFLGKVLGWRPWVPLSKLVYGAYLTHMTFQLRWAAKVKGAQEIGYFDLMSMSLSDMVLSFLTALCLYLMIEAPFRRIFRELIMPSNRQQLKTNLDNNNDVIIEQMINHSNRNNNNNNNNGSNLEDSRL